MSTTERTFQTSVIARHVRARFASVARGLGLPPRTLFAVLLTQTLLAVVVLALKALRVAHYHYDAPLVGFQRAALFGSELCALAGLTSAALAIALLGAARGVPRLAMALIIGVADLTFLVSCLAHGYFTETGGTLDYTLFAFAGVRPRETGPIVLSAIGAKLGTLLVLMPIALLLPGWWLVMRGDASEALEPMRRWLRRALACTCLAALLLMAASRVRVTDVEPGFVREPLVQLVTGFWTAHAANRSPQLRGHVPARASGATALRRLSTEPPPNVVIIVLESARADATTPYARQLATTPFLAQLAKQGTLVERAYSVIPHTSKALVAILCGFDPRTTTELVETQPAGLPGLCLPRLLHDAGYETAFFQAPRKAFEAYPELMKNLGFDRFTAGDDMPQRGFEVVNYFGFEDAIMLGPNRKWLTQRAQKPNQPFLAVYLTNASHHPYGSPKRWPKRRLSGNPTKNAYLNAISYVDSIVGKLIEQYQAAGLYERTLFVVLGDHGEGFGEHGMWTHDDIMYEEGIRIPLVFRAPAAQQRAARVSGPVNQLAVVPTILDVLGFAAEGGKYDAASIYAKSNKDPVNLSCFRNAHCLASVRDDHKLIYSYGDRATQLFDLRRDPGERHNIASDQPELVASSVRDLLNWETGVDELHQKSSQSALKKYVQRTPPENVPNACRVRFGELVELIGFKSESRRRDGALLSYFLHVLQPLPAGYHFVMRLRSGFWHSRSLDEKPARGLYPYWRWQAGDYITSMYRTDWPDSWEVMDACLELLDADGNAVSARDVATGAHFKCAPLSTLDHKTQRELPGH